MKCLVVGGTGFLGSAVVAALQAAGHQVTILTRGTTAAALPPEIEQIHADRFEDISPLKGRAFDWVFDSCAYTPAAVDQLLATLGENLQRYVLMSSISVYGDFSTAGLTEGAAVPEATEADHEAAARLPKASRASAAAYGASYGPLKRACEQVAETRLGTRATALRLGLLVGAGDYSDRLTWWVRRVDEASATRQQIPVPAPMERPVQMIDVRDVARFALLCAETSLGGAWNVTGQPLPLLTALTEMARLSGTTPDFVPIAEEAITAAEVAPWSDIPLMVPTLPAFQHFLNVSAQKAEAAGLTCRPLPETLTPLLDWDRSRRPAPLKCGMSPAQEALLLTSLPAPTNT